MSAIIQIHNLTHRYDQRTALSDVSLDINQGEIFGFLGPNGSGKTTSLRMLCGLLTPDAGEGKVLGLDFRRQAAEVKR